MSRTPAPLPEAGIAVPVALLALLLAAMVSLPCEDFALDDAWIHLDYAKSLELGEGWSYNPGDHEAGCSSPLWVLLLWAWPTAGATVPRVFTLAMLLHALTAWCAAGLTIAIAQRRASEPAPLPLRSIAWLTGALVASAPLSLHGVASGMEVSLASALAMAQTWAIVDGRARAAAALGALAVWARPELAALPFVAFAVAWPLRARLPPSLRRAILAAALGATIAAAAWSAWLLATVGAPLPNALYVKGRGGGASGLAYLAEQVLPWQPWLVGLGGVVLAAAALRHEWRAGAAMLAWLGGTTLAMVLLVAGTRPLHAGVQFFEARYFVPLLTPAAIVVAFGLAALPRRLAALAVLPVAVMVGLQARDTVARARAASEDTHVLHTQPARWVAAELPRDAVVATEGAGALRWGTARTMTIVDLVGLNDHVAAHRHFDRAAKICRWVARAPTHAVVPAHWLPVLAEVFPLQPLASFDDPAYTQVEPVGPMRVVVVALGPARRACDDGD
ncbi:MAG: hypothetical protein IPK74_22345 [Deltaproteobacteria bacterium]|nr:hypothetical protein [Deltaproteobacteria bacterium]